MRTTKVSDEATAAGGLYRPVGLDESGKVHHQPASRLQWFFIGALTFGAAIVLASKVGAQSSTLWLSPPPLAGGYSSNSSMQVAQRRGRQQRWARLSMGRMGAASSFFLRSKRRSIKKQAAKAATRSVVLIGSHFSLGNDLLKRVFGELCQRSRLSLRCEPVWGGAHDLKSLAAARLRKRRLVWLESDASTLLRTFRGVKAHASDFRLVHVLWDPQQACASQWEAASSDGALGSSSSSSNGSLPSSLPQLCEAMGMDAALPTLYKRAKRHGPLRVLQPRLEELVSRRQGPAAWRQLFKFLGLPESKNGELMEIANDAVAELGLRGKVGNRDAPGWVHARLLANATLHAKLRRLRRDLEYAGVAGGAASMRRRA